jgi:hypothetical protein
MTAPKYTASPWRVLKGKYGLQIHSETHWIANMKCESCPAHEEGNANVMAASPELLELARQYLNDMRHPPAPDSRERRVSLIEKVIAKAEGRA